MTGQRRSAATEKTDEDINSARRDDSCISPAVDSNVEHMYQCGSVLSTPVTQPWLVEVEADEQTVFDLNVFEGQVTKRSRDEA